MGGAVASLFLEKYPEVFSAAVLCAPMIAPQTRGVPFPVVMKPWSGPENFATSCATDPRRFAWYDSVKTSTKAFHNSVPSYRWTHESLAARTEHFPIVERKVSI